MKDKIEKKRLTILQILAAATSPMSGQQINDHLSNMGIEMSERTVRFHLLAMDGGGLTENIGRQGRLITKKGRQELASARAYEKVGFLAARIDQLSYAMSFDLAQKTGTVVVNISLIKKLHLKEGCALVTRVFEHSYSMGNLLALYDEQEQIGETVVPKGYFAIGTVCSISLNGILLKNGIPVTSRFGGLLELKNGKPTRFVEIINYDGTSLDPLEVFIKSEMTDYKGATSNGNGLVGASFREIPIGSRDKVVALSDKLKQVGLGGFLAIGWPGQSLFEIPIQEGRIGAVVMGGLNPAALLIESGIPVISKALTGFIEYKNLFHFKELNAKTKHLKGSSKN